MSNILSIGKYLSGGDLDNRDEVLLRAVSLLVDGISQHAVAGELGEYQRFRAELHDLCARVAPGMPAADVLLLVGSALKALESYNRGTSASLRLQSSELQSMVAMLTQTVTLVGAGQKRTLDSLQEIEGQIEKASAYDDIRMLKVRLFECLASVREETARQQQDSAELLRELKTGLEAAKTSAAAAMGKIELDPVTGLLGRSDAESALAEAIQAGGKAYVAVFVVERVHIVNTRFGYDVGNRMLVEFQKWLQAVLSEEADLFRWSGPAFAVLLKRDAPIDFVRAELGRICAKKLELDVDTGARSLLLPVSAAFTVMPLQSSAKLVIHKLDAFITAHFREKVQP